MKNFQSHHDFCYEKASKIIRLFGSQHSLGIIDDVNTKHASYTLRARKILLLFVFNSPHSADGAEINARSFDKISLIARKYK